MTGTATALARRASAYVDFWFRRGPAGMLIGLASTAALLGLSMSVVRAAPGAVAAIIAVTIAAGKRWPQVRIGSYFTSAKSALPAAAVAGGLGIQIVAAGAISSSPGVVGMIAAGALAVIALSLCMQIFEGRIMKSIFELVPAEQQPELREFAGGAGPVMGTAGQRVDFSHVDPEAVEQAVKTRVIGQDNTVQECVRTAFRRARLARPNKPLATFLFVGATGAGKTELAKALAAELFDSRLIRIDCNELSAESGAQRLIGAPPGYIGSDRGGQLCRDIVRLGTGVILFDEIEKAHPAVLKTIMGLLDEARLTEQSTGQTYSATGFLILLTSNAQQAEIAQIAAATDDTSERARKVKDELKNAGFLPEVLARIDAVFPFAPLSRTALIEIVGRFLTGFARDVQIDVTEVDAELLIDLVTRAEQMRNYGVREVVRAVESAVVDQLLDMKDHGIDRVAIHVTGGRIVVQPAGGVGVQKRAV